MKINKWINFSGIDLTEQLNENVQQAKTYLVKREIESRTKGTRKDPKDIKLSDVEIKMIENNKDFLRIKEMLRESPNYVFTFVKFFFEDEIPHEELEQLYNRLREYRQNLNELPMSVDRYASLEPDSKDQRSGYERLSDDLTQISLNRIAKKFVDKLPGEFIVNNKQAKDYGVTVPSMKDEYRRAPNKIKQQVASISQSLLELGEEKFNFFVSKIKRYRTLNEVINAANNFIRASNIDGQQKYIQALIQVNKTYGELNGAEVVFDENNILIVEIKSFHANRALNANTSHCIKDSQSHWDSYVGDKNFNKQYYIYNFNLSGADVNSIIGITIEPGQKIRAAHSKNDGGVSSTIKSILTDWEKKYNINDSLWSYLLPMTSEEIELKKKRIEANKKIVNDNISLATLKQLILDGGDPSAGGGKPLINATREDDIEKVKYLLEIGASPNMGEPIKYSKNLKMIKIFVENGAEMTKDILNDDLLKDYEATKFLLDAGLDVNFDKGYPLRRAVKLEAYDVVELLVEYGARIEDRRFMAVRLAAERGNLKFLDVLFRTMDRREIDYNSFEVSPGVYQSFIIAMDIIPWIKDSRFLKDPKDLKVIVDYLTKKTKIDTSNRKNKINDI